MRMELINKAIEKLGSSRKFSKVSRHNTIPSTTKSNSTKEEWLKAMEMQIDSNGSDRRRRSINTKEKELDNLVSDFKKARDSLYEEYDWKRYNLSDIWKKWDNTVKVARLPSDDFYPNNTSTESCACTIEIGATATIFGALILLAFCIMKLVKKLNTPI